MKVMLDKGAFMPTKAHETDAGFDLKCCERVTVPARGSAVIKTGVHIELPPSSVGMLKSKSGLNVKHGITSEGVIDEGYTGAIVAKLYNNSDEDYTFEAGDKITQLVILPVFKVNIIQTDIEKFAETERGEKGFGSSGR